MMNLKFIFMALVGAALGETSRKNPPRAIISILASGFLAFVTVNFLESLGFIDEKVLLSLAGILGFLGEKYTKDFLLMLLEKYKKKKLW